VTIIDADALTDDATAARWLRSADSAWALPLLSQFLAAHRVSAADPYAPDADPSRAVEIRVGYGSGDQVAVGEWTEIRSLEPPEPAKVSKRSKHRPADRLAAVLSGRDAVLACEELTLRARADLDRGRDREAALQLEAALSAALAELAGWVSIGDLASRLDELHEYSERVASAASAARSGTLDAAGVEVVSAALARLEAALRARALYAAEPG
jgi:hypothetical protein